MTPRSTTGKWKRGAAAGAGFALVATLVATQAGPSGLSASSHREAPLIAGDPRADNTDVYAFVSPDDDDTVTMIANWIPFEEPNGGPNFYLWAENTKYNIKIDNDGDAKVDLTYTWIFDTVTKDPSTFLVNTGPFSSVNDDTLNVYQTYDLYVSDDNGTPDDQDDDLSDDDLVLDDAIAAPSISGEASNTDDDLNPNYQLLVDEAVESGTLDVSGVPGLSDGDQLKSFAGQADDPFFLDLRVFDILYGGGKQLEVGEDTLAGYNVNTIALQVPKDAVALNNSTDDNPVIGIWSTTDRPTTRNADGTDPDPDTDDFTQVSRLGNPLVNEVVIPLALKDAFNGLDPRNDATVADGAAVQAVTNPILPPLVNTVYGAPVPGDNNGDGDNDDDGDDPRTDLVEIFLQGVSVANGGTGDPNQHPALAADLNSLALNADVDSIQPAEMLRLNMGVPVTADPSDMGVLGGDLQGFPNGRRLADDVVDIEILAAEGAVYEDGLDPAVADALAPFDSVDRNDRDFKDDFPYVALPHLDSVNQGTQPPDNTPRNPSIISINPDRILDTRQGNKPGAESVTVVNVGDALVPSDAKAVFLNITAAQAQALGYVTAYACDGDGDGTQDSPPTSSSLNPDPARIVSGVVAVAPDANGDVCLFTKTSAQLIVDVQAYIPSTSAYTPLPTPARTDTRSGVKPAAGSTLQIDVSDLDGDGVDDGSTAVLANITSARTDGDGYITAYPCGEDVPNTSNLNTRVGTNRANLASVKVGDDGNICVFTNQSTDIIVDVIGAFPAASDYVPITPERLVDTRIGTGYSGSKPIAGQVIEFDARGPGTNVPDDSGTVFLNVTGVQPDGEPGYLTVFPCGEEPPTASNLNLQDLNTAAAAVAKVGDNDRVCVYTFQPAHVIVDLVGYFPGTVLPT